LVKVFQSFPHSLEEDAGIVPQVDIGCFFPHTLQLFINKPTVLRLSVRAADSCQIKHDGLNDVTDCYVLG